MKWNALVFIYMTVSVTVFAQPPCPPASDKKAVKWYEDAKDARKKQGSYDQVKENLLKAVAIDSLYAEAWKFLGDAAYVNKDYRMASKAYQNAIVACSDIGPQPYFRLGAMYFAEKNYEKAMEQLAAFLRFGKINEADAREAEKMISRSRLLMNPVPFDPVPLEGVSTPDPEYLASISPDGEYCFFTRRFEIQPKASLTPVSVEKFMYSEKKDGVFTSGELMPPPFNRKQSNNEGSPSISIDNKYLYFTQNNDGNFDIYVSSAIGSGWDEPQPVFKNPADNEFWESQPSVSPDGRKLYFATFRDSVNRTSDIYYSVRQNGTWSSPQPLSGPVNTPGNEKSPFLHPDNKTLYFSSDSHSGMGGYDIYMSKSDSNGNWTTPVNLGYPINTEADEVGFFVSTDGKTGYFASNSIAGSGGYDIYRFSLHTAVKPEKVLFIKGEVKDENNEPSGVKLELKNAMTKAVMEVNYDSLTGKYASVVLFDEDYILTVKKKGYAFTSAYFSKNDTLLERPAKVDLQLSTTQKGKAYTLNNILFATNSAEMNRQNRIIVEQFAEYLELNPTLKVAIHGHTDNQGNPNDNLTLSEARAKAVYDYLIELGIDAQRLRSKGFGETKPMAPNETEKGRSLNRRTEFIIESL